MKISHLRDYRTARREAYPEVGDQLDALWKALATMDLPPDAKAMLEQIGGVKKRFPRASQAVEP